MAHIYGSHIYGWELDDALSMWLVNFGDPFESGDAKFDFTLGVCHARTRMTLCPTKLADCQSRPIEDAANGLLLMGQ